MSARVLLTLSVKAEARNNTPIVSNDFQTILLSWTSPQIITNDKTVPTTMQTTQMVKHTLLNTFRFILLPFSDLIQTHISILQRPVTPSTVKPNTVILHSPADETIPFADSQELLRNSGLPESALITVGTDHRLADPDSLKAMLEAVERVAAQ
jgi:hypothetical protein